MATAGYNVRPPAVAGAFYPAEPRELKETVTELLAAAREAASATAQKAPKAIIAPHAGYAYSGPIAGSAFAALAPNASNAGNAGNTGNTAGIRRVVLLGPAHRVPVRGLALPEAKGFATPLGVLSIDPEMARAVSRLPQVRLQPEAHVAEHSLEVEIPFLQILFGEIKLLPLVVGEASGEEVAEVLEQVWGDEETAVVISSDLSHYLPYDTARRTDRETADAILRLDGPIDPRRACGAYPINGLLLAARRQGLVPSLLDLRNSGDTAGDRRQVVGYGAFAFHAS